jgi:putative SOS response-associated peptidase YedK
MCGRFDRHRPVTDFLEMIGIPGLVFGEGHSVAPSYNVAPSREAIAVCAGDAGTAPKALVWGFTPAWAKNPKMPKPINARAETVAEKPMFRDGFRSSRCLVLCDGYYEWQRQADGTKQPFYLTVEDGAPFLMAGLWARNTTLAESPVESFCVITTEANASCRQVHPRMPLILNPEHHEAWLNPSSLNLDTVAEMLRPPTNAMRLSAVSRFVNSPNNDSPQCIAPISQA